MTGNIHKQWRKCLSSLKPGDTLHFKNGANVALMHFAGSCILIGHNHEHGMMLGWKTADRVHECHTYPLLRNFTYGYWFSYLDMESVEGVTRSK